MGPCVKSYNLAPHPQGYSLLHFQLPLKVSWNLKETVKGYREPKGRAQCIEPCGNILKRKRNATLFKMVVTSFSSKNSIIDNKIAKNRYLPCIQHQNQTAVTYGWRAATRNVRQSPFLKSQSSKIVPILRKNVLNQYRLLKTKW